VTTAELSRRAAIAAAAATTGAALGKTAPEPLKRVDAGAFGVRGDGVADDTAALQRALDATFSRDGGMLVVPPGSYRITRTLRISANPHSGNITHRNGISASGARLISALAKGESVVEITSRANHRFFLLEGLDIQGNGKEGHGIVLECESNDNFLYNFCIRDVVVQNCGGDGCRLIGNVFEGQIFNSYFRDNHGNGATFSHGEKAGVLSAVHVFGSVFGQNRAHGAAILRNSYDVGFHGCYFLLNGRFGLLAENGCSLLSNCGFENNHTLAPDFEHGDAGISLNSFGTLIACSGYSIAKQTALVKAYVTAPLTMVGCSGGGDGAAAKAALAKLNGTSSGSATIVGCQGPIEQAPNFGAIVMGRKEGGADFTSDWNSRSLLRLGEFVLWVGTDGKLRLKKGMPASDSDGAIVGMG
jgi:pectate lyase-like protein